MSTQVQERDPIAKLGIKLISADNHVNEPRNLFIDRFKPEGQSARVIDGKDGGEGWSLNGEPRRAISSDPIA